MKLIFVFTMLVVVVIEPGCGNKLEKKVMPIKYNSLESHCIGRHIIQLPNAFVRSDSVSGYFKPSRDAVDDSSLNVLINDKNITVKEFTNRISIRRADLKGHDAFSADILRMERKLNDYAIMFRVQAVDEAYQDELHFMLGKNIVSVKLDSFKNKFILAEEQLIKFMSNFSITDQGKAKGFCLGSLSVNGDFSEENGGSYWLDDAGNTFDITIDSFKVRGSTTLLQRMKDPNSLLSLFNIGHTVLRSGERTVAGMPAQEWLGWTNLGEVGNEKTFKFVLETMPTKGSKETPNMRITFDSAQKLPNGTNARTNMTDDEAIAVWDAVISSIQFAR